MLLPSLVHYETVTEYRSHYERMYCRGRITTFDNIRVYFSPNQFEHAFYESSNRDGIKDLFSQVRAERINWIKATLENRGAAIFKGWDKKKSRYDATSRVAVVYEDFVVIIRLRLTRNNQLKGNFITCYQAVNSIQKIRNSPLWSQADCFRELGIR